MPTISFCNRNKTFLLSQRKVNGHFNMPTYHFHNMYEIYYLLSGERYYFINDRTYHIKKGDLVFINTDVLHKTTTARASDHKRLLLQFKKEFLIPSSNNLYDSLFCPFITTSNIIRFASVQDQNNVNNILYKMIHEIQQQHTGFEAYLQALLMELLILSNRYIEQNNTNSFEYPSEIHKKVSEIVQYINKNYMKPLSLSSVSKHFFISSYYLTRIFKKVSGFTFIEYLNSVRIKEAQKLLAQSHMKVIRIAEEVGFTSISHFGRVFKTLTGLSPLQYRKKVQ